MVHQLLLGVIQIYRLQRKNVALYSALFYLTPRIKKAITQACNNAVKAVRVRDGNTHSTLVVSACGLQMAMVHPQGTNCMSKTI